GARREPSDPGGNRDRCQSHRSLVRPDDRARLSSACGPEGGWTEGRTQMMTSLLALNALNFFMADVRDGFGPFLGVLLQGKGWSAAEIGLVMTIGGYAGMIATMPLGALVDATRAKRGLMIASALAIIAASMVILGVPAFPAISTAQAINGIAGAAVGPAIAGLTLGLVKQAGFAHQLGRNEAFNHAGNVNAAMLPLLGQALVARGAGDPSAATAVTVVVAQLTMVPMALLASRLAESRGYWIVLVLALVALPVRGVIAATVADSWGLVPVQ